MLAISRRSWNTYVIQQSLVAYTRLYHSRLYYNLYMLVGQLLFTVDYKAVGMLSKVSLFTTLVFHNQKFWKFITYQHWIGDSCGLLATENQLLVETCCQLSLFNNTANNLCKSNSYKNSMSLQSYRLPRLPMTHVILLSRPEKWPF